MAAVTDMNGKVVVVTGAGGGIGREFALAFAAAGAKVIVNDIGTSLRGEGEDAGPAEQVVQEIIAAGGEAVANTDSVANWDSAQNIVETAITHFGRIDGVVNNAGIIRDRMFHNMSPDEWRAVIDVHLMGSFNVARAAAPHFKGQGSGAYVHITSNSGLIGSIGQANYSAAKMGIVGLSRSIAYDMQRYNVRSNCLAPAAWSRMVGNVPTDTPERRQLVKRMKSNMAPAKIAPLAVYLLSDAAAGVTGQVFYVRANEIFIYSQPRAIKSVHRSEGWSAKSIAEHAMPVLQSQFTPIEQVAEVFPYEAI